MWIDTLEVLSLEEKVYIDKWGTVQELRDKIMRHINGIETLLCPTVNVNFFCRRSHGEMWIPRELGIVEIEAILIVYSFCIVLRRTHSDE